MKLLILLLSLLNFSFVNAQNDELKEVYRSDNLVIKEIKQNLWLHISFITLSNGYEFPCNGMVYKNEKELVVFDSPTTVTASDELIEWFSKDKTEIKNLIINHFHNDCIGGLSSFENSDFNIHANERTTELMDSLKSDVITFQDSSHLNVGNTVIINAFCGKAHSPDNIVSWMPNEKVLFGGCMIKSIGAGKGNLKDADVEEWPRTVRIVRSKFGDPQMIVVPGHGNIGGADLLDYTIELFKE
ncbi:MAG: subclass B1 metallo-beta-lactamase [Flavobacteriales bacterium]|nr:subclass B1 metallo-beta-lactamase [Flavobacteriales bacterium]